MIRFSARCGHPSVAPVRLTATIVLAASLMAGYAVAQRPTTSRSPIVIDAVVANVDDAANTADFTTISVTQGNTRITADRASATGVGSQNSHWVFTGRVTITSETRGSLWADQATLEYRDGELLQAVATGSPARFDQRRNDIQQAERGQADEIAYDAKKETVRLQGHAQLSAGKGAEITAPVFVYHVRDGKLQALSANGTPAVHITTKPTGTLVPQ
jgi:lipopolysaccharide transport protein LptA